MTTILDIPPEILNLILSDVDVQSCVIDLWKCGCRRLNVLLARGGCTIVSLVDQKRRTKSRWPKMLSELLHLRSLSINRAQFGLMGSKKLGYALQSLSKTLLTLKLVCLEAESCFLLNPPPLNSFRHNGKWKQPESSTAPRMWPISRKLPNLMRLTVETPFPVLLPEDMPYLPPLLTSFEVGHQTTELRGCPSALPRGLVHFSETNLLRLSLDDPRILADLPPGLTHYQRSVVWHADTEALQLLPKSLTFCPGLSVNWVSKATAEVIPPLLHTLHIQFDVKSPIPFLKHLTDLMCITSNWSREILITLPPGLTQLEIANIDWETLQSQDDFPSSLRTLRLCGIAAEENRFNPTPNTILFLPNTLTSFKTWAYTNLEFIPKLPASLTLLHIEPSRVRMQRVCIYALPPKLREFKADITWTLPPGWSALTRAILEPMKENISSTLLHLTLSGWAYPFPPALPQGLLTLYAGMTAFTHKQLALLPRSLTILKFDRLESMATYEAFVTFPRTLKVLSIENIERDVVTDCFEGLPDDLQFLRFDPSFSLKPSILAFLPPRLTSLEICLTDVTEGDLERLPRSLTHIKLNVAHSKLNRTAAHFLPPNLDFKSKVLAIPQDFVMTEYQRIERQELLFPSQKSDPPSTTPLFSTTVIQGSTK